MLFLENLIRALLILNGSQSRHSQQALLGYYYPKKAVEAQIAGFNTGKATPHMFETDELYAMWEQLLQTADPKANDELLRKIGNYKFENFNPTATLEEHALLAQGFMGVQKATFPHCLRPQNRDFTCANLVEALK